MEKIDITKYGYEELAIRFLSNNGLFSLVEGGDMHLIVKRANELYIFTALQINELRLVASEQRSKRQLTLPETTKTGKDCM